MQAFDAHAQALRYSVSIGRNGYPTRTVLDVPEGEKLTLVRSAAGRWTDGDSQPLPDLEGWLILNILTCQNSQNSTRMRRGSVPDKHRGTYPMSVHRPAVFQAIRRLGGLNSGNIA